MKKNLKITATAALMALAVIACKKKEAVTADTTTTTTEVQSESYVEPVQTTTATDPAVQQRVQDAVKDFPSVKVETINGELTLTGTVSPEQARKIKESVDALKVGKVNYNYTVK